MFSLYVRFSLYDMHTHVKRTSEAEKRLKNKHIQPQLKFRCSYKKKNVRTQAHTCQIDAKQRQYLLISDVVHLNFKKKIHFLINN